MKIPFLKQIKSENITRKEYSYSQDKTVLKFTLRTDIKTELRNFRDLILKALEDIDRDLTKL